MGDADSSPDADAPPSSFADALAGQLRRRGTQLKAGVAKMSSGGRGSLDSSSSSVFWRTRSQGTTDFGSQDNPDAFSVDRLMEDVQRGIVVAVTEIKRTANEVARAATQKANEHGVNIVKNVKYSEKRRNTMAAYGMKNEKDSFLRRMSGKAERAGDGSGDAAASAIPKALRSPQPPRRGSEPAEETAHPNSPAKPPRSARSRASISFASALTPPRLMSRRSSSVSNPPAAAPP